MRILCISIHAPLRGATNCNYPGHHHQRISIHAPLRGATLGLTEDHVELVLFQSTLPCGERHNGVLDQETMSVFQSTLPCGERRPHGGTHINPIMISIHAPLRGATLQKLERGKTWNVNFNPRSPAGSDGISKEIQLRLAYFNPRSPAGSDSS